jgi:flagellar hook-length control protein FliK
VGMQSQEFGNIDIRTSVARHIFSAQISVERGDVAKSMTADLPALYHRLADQQVPVASIVIQGQNLATSSGLSQDAQSRNWQPQGQGGTRSNAEPFLPKVSEALDSTGRTFDSAGRLDIRI